jgi:hypothetical protein
MKTGEHFVDRMAGGKAVDADHCRTVDHDTLNIFPELRRLSTSSRSHEGVTCSIDLSLSSINTCVIAGLLLFANAV